MHRKASNYIFFQFNVNGADKRVHEWRASSEKQIVQCTVNQRQVVKALAGGELVYFKINLESIWILKTGKV